MTHSLDYLARRFDEANLAHVRAELALEAATVSGAPAAEIARLAALRDAANAARKAAHTEWAVGYAAAHRMAPAA
ncbi:hypothetical protein [Jannaschia formosa]|uniref:hypothetical protein n=1 Tax=Jannaschia formosa TaxID=2259592 RepID=UPI000E1C389F|nr:hypothetical protein [Jannaschia formosa]TFL16408.1 hypothetical protein DR046_20000 [Jannaschia formosa]